MTKLEIKIITLGSLIWSDYYEEKSSRVCRGAQVKQQFQNAARFTTTFEISKNID